MRAINFYHASKKIIINKNENKNAQKSTAKILHKIRDKNVIKQEGVKMGLEAFRNMRKMQTKVIMSNISKV